MSVVVSAIFASNAIILRRCGINASVAMLSGRGTWIRVVKVGSDQKVNMAVVRASIRGSGSSQRSPFVVLARDLVMHALNRAESRSVVRKPP